MVPVRTVEEFAKQNEKQLRKLFSKKTGIYDKNLIDDAIQEFYVRLIQTKALESYDKNQGAFNTYLFNLMCWIMPQMSKKNFRHNYEVLSTIDINTNNLKTDIREVDIWDVINGYGGGCYYHTDKLPDDLLKKQLKEEGSDEISGSDLDKIKKNGKNVSVGNNSKEFISYRVDPMFRPSFLEIEEERVVFRDYLKFKEHIRRTESKEWANRMITYMDYKLCGCKGTDIAKILKITNAMIRLIKEKSYKKYIKWRSNNDVL